MVLRGQHRTPKQAAYESANRVEARLKKEGHDPARASSFHYQRIGRVLFDEGGNLERDDPFRSRVDRYPSEHVAIGFRDAERAAALMGGLNSPSDESTSLPRRATQSARASNMVDTMAGDISPASSSNAHFESRSNLENGDRATSGYDSPTRSSFLAKVTAHARQNHATSTEDQTSQPSWPIVSYPSRDSHKHAKQLITDISRIQSSIVVAQARGDDTALLDCFDNFTGSTLAFVRKVQSEHESDSTDQPSAGATRKRSHDVAFGDPRDLREADRSDSNTSILPAQSLEGPRQDFARTSNLTRLQKSIFENPELGVSKKAILLLICEIDRGKYISSQTLLDIMHAIDGFCAKEADFRVVVSRKQSSDGKAYRECQLCRHEQILHDLLWNEVEDFLEVPLHRVRWQDRSSVSIDARLQHDFHALAVKRRWLSALRDERDENGDIDDNQEEMDHSCEQDQRSLYVEVLAELPLRPRNGKSLEENIANWTALTRE